MTGYSPALELGLHLTPVDRGDDSPLTQQYRAESPYGVPVTSVSTVSVKDDTPLLPFEQRQLQTLIQQVDAAPKRVKTAFYRYIDGHQGPF